MAMDPAGLGQGMGGGRYPLEGRHVCPFCGAVNETMEGPCPNCTMTNTADTRKATKSRIGPWYVLQSRNPAAPGMRYETLLGFVRKGRVKARSIVRGPTTHQLWRFACQVKGLSREFGLCYSCGGSIEREAQLCPQCNRLQDPPPDPDVFLEGQAAAAPESVAQPSGARPVAPAEALQETRPAPIFKELKLPPLTDFPSIAPPAAAAPAASAPAAAPATPAPAAPAAAVTPPPAAAPAPPVSAAPSPPAGAPAADPAPKRNANDVFLSAKDLAAAFQLGFDGESDTRQQRGGVFDRDPPWTAAGERADQPARVAHRRPRRKRRLGRTIMVLLLLAVVGLVGYLAVDAAARQRVFAWGEAKYMALTGANLYPDLSQPRPTTATPTPPAPSPERTSPTGLSPRNDSITGTPAAVPVPSNPAPPTTVPSPAATTGAAHELPPRATPGGAATLPGAASGSTGIARDTPAPVPPPAAAPATPSAAASAPGSAAPGPGNASVGRPQEARPAASTQPQPQPQPRLAPGTQPARPPVQAAGPQRAETPRLSLDEARRRSAALWNDALIAEEDGEYHKARDLYEQMMKLPPEVWYQGIESRLKFAKEMAKKK